MPSLATAKAQAVVNSITVGLILYCTVLALAFVVTYHVRASWWKTPTGQSIMTLWLVISAVFILSTVRQFVDPTSLAFLIFRLLVFASVPCVLTWHYILLIKAQRQARKERNGRTSFPE